jgi:hemolysin activation/secretion protein
MNKLNHRAVLIGMLLICAQDATLAQTPTSIPDTIRNPEVLGNEPLRLPEQQPGPPPKSPEMVLPPLESTPQDGQPLSGALEVEVRKIQLTGNHVFSDQELSVITQPYENRIITSEELQEIRYKLSRYYIDRGYINSGAIIPDQQIEDGMIQIEIIEGQLIDIGIEGNDWLRTEYIKRRIERGQGPPLNISNIQQRLLLLQQDPLIERINAELRPGLKPGESQLNVRVKEARPYQMGLQFANDRSPSIGSYSGRIWLAHNNLTGFGDALTFGYGRTEGLNDFDGSYSLPLNAYDTRLRLYYQNSNSDVVESQFSSANIRSRSETIGASLSHPIIQTAEQTLSIALGFEHRRSKTFLGDTFSFSPGVPEEGRDKGESTVSVVRFSQDWLDRSMNQVIAVRSRFSVGIDVFDPTVNSSGPDGKFFAWLGQFQWIRRLPLWDSQLIFRGDLQLASQPLLPLEKFSVGGQHSVRGYRENQLVRDNGFAASLEWRVPVFRLPIPGLSQSADDGMVQLAVFADFGWSENIALPPPDLGNKVPTSPNPRTISSAGLGIRWDPSQKLHTELYWGKAFRNIAHQSDYDPQDSGIHFLISTQLF